MALKEGVTISEHNVIYHLVDDLKEQISARLPLKDEEELLGMLQHLFLIIMCTLPSLISLLDILMLNFMMPTCVEGRIFRKSRFKMLKWFDLV